MKDQARLANGGLDGKGLLQGLFHKRTRTLPRTSLVPVPLLGRSSSSAGLLT
jgi:hypothetical protein